MPDDIERLISDLTRQRQRLQKNIDELETSKKVTDEIVEAVESLRSRRDRATTTGEETMRRIANRNDRSSR